MILTNSSSTFVPVPFDEMQAKKEKDRKFCSNTVLVNSFQVGRQSTKDV